MPPPSRGWLPLARANGPGGAEGGSPAPQHPALAFLRGLQKELPVLGLVARLTSPEGVAGSGAPLSYPEYCRHCFETAGRPFNTAVAELARSRGVSAKSLLFLCWAVSSGGGLVADDGLGRAAARLTGRNADLEHELLRMDEALDAATKRRARMKTPPARPDRGAATALLASALRTYMRLGDDALQGEDGEHHATLLRDWP